MKNIPITLLMCCILSAPEVMAQVGINSDGVQPDPSAMLDVRSSTSGLLIPRMTLEERNQISNPASGLLIFCTTDNQFYYNKGTPVNPLWILHSNLWKQNGSFIYYDGGRVGIGDNEPSHMLSVYSGSDDKTLKLIGPEPSLGVGAKLNFGDGNFVFLQEDSDDCLTIMGSQRISLMGGYVGIGTTSPLSSLTISNSIFDDVLRLTGSQLGQIGSGAKINFGDGDFVSISEDSDDNLKISAAGRITLSAYSTGVGTTNPDQSAKLDIQSTNMGVLLPRMTRVQRNMIMFPAEGLMVYCTNCGSNGSLSIYTSGNWMTFAPCVVGQPTSGNHQAGPGSITWAWNEVTGAVGYRWNTVQDYETSIDMGSQLSKYESGLVCGFTYTRYVWAYSACGESTGAPLTFTAGGCWICGQPFTDPRDNKVYNTIVIGSQCWMKENLNTGVRINGGTVQSNNGVIEKYCYDDDEASCTVYGGLYLWSEMLSYAASSTSNPSGRQGICPSGWHMPSDAEWCQLETFLDATIGCSSVGYRGLDGGGKMKEQGTTYWSFPNAGATNSSGFTARPGGIKNSGGYNYRLNDALFWSTSENSTGNAWHRKLYFNIAQINRDVNDKINALSARCLKD